MNVVKISAGLGNQMFQYAFYRALKERRPETKMDTFEFNYRKHHNGYELQKIFDITPNYATQAEISRLADVSKDLWSDIRRKFLKIKLKTDGTYIDESILGNGYHPDLLESDEAYLDGFWQTEKYFESISDIIREDFTFKNPLDKDNSKIADHIISSNSVSIHIRRGDYVKSRRLDSFGSVCTDLYYENAIQYVQSVVARDLCFYVFSDDLTWVHQNMQIPNAHYVDINCGDNSYKDMQLMSLCKHNIIANSSFSWWGAWLNRAEDKIVVAPSTWIRNRDFPDIIPNSWKSIPVE